MHKIRDAGRRLEMRLRLALPFKINELQSVLRPLLVEPIICQ